MLMALFIALKKIFYSGDGGYLLRKALKSPRRIIITRLQHLGDVSVFLPVITSLRKIYPESKIYALSKHKTGYELLRRCPFVNKVIRSEKWGMLDKLRLWWWMWNSPVDIFIVSTQDWGRALWGFFGGARTIVAYRRVFLDGRWHSEKLKWALSVSCGDVSLDEQETERNMRLLETLKGSKVELAIFEPRWWNKDEEKTATALLKEYGFGSGRFVAVVPGTKRSSRMWQVEKWAELLKRLKQEFGLSCVILGAESEKPVCSKIKSIADKDVADLSGKTGIGELLYLVSEAALVVSVDTGVAHLANCFSKPMVVLFGPGELPKWKPFGNPNAKVIVKRFDCAPCYNYSCPKGEVSPCMAAIEVSDVMSAIYGVLKR